MKNIQLKMECENLCALWLMLLSFSNGAVCLCQGFMATKALRLKVGIIFLFVSLSVLSQEHHENELLPFEEITILTDRDLYLSGERIWFTASCKIVGYEDQHMSMILYVELFNNTHKSVVGNKYRLIDGKVHGTIDIPGEFLTGNYFLRAYTQYLRNFPPEYISTRIITIVNPHLPLPVRDENQEVRNTDIPENNDISIKTDLSDPDQIYLTIINEKISSDLSVNKYTLVLASEDMNTISESSVFLNNKKTHQTFATSEMTSGLYYFVLKNQNRETVLNHPFYYQDKNKTGIYIKCNKDKYKPRENVELEILPENLEDGEILDLSVTVVKKGTIYNQQEQLELLKNYPQLFTNYLLSCIHINKDNSRAIEQYLTHYGKLLNAGKIHQIPPEISKPIEWLPDIRDISISGIAIDENTEKPLSDILVFLSAGKKHPQIHLYKTGEDGKFVFSLNNFEEDQEIFFCPIRWDKNNIPMIKVFSDFLPFFSELPDIPVLLDTSDLHLIEELLINDQASKAFRTETGRDTIPISHFPNSIDNPPISVVLDDYIETPDMETVFRELVPRVRLKKDGDDYSLSVFNFDEEVYYDDPLILVDNIPVFDVNGIIKVPPSNVKKIEVHNKPLILGDNVVKGIVMITTYTDDFAGLEMPPSATFLKYQTLTPTLIFDPSGYDNEEKKRNPTADFRTLLYWNPELIINSDTTISFYTSDHESEYTVIVRGRTSDGIMVIGQTDIEVGR